MGRGGREGGGVLSSDYSNPAGAENSVSQCDARGFCRGFVMIALSATHISLRALAL